MRAFVPEHEQFTRVKLQALQAAANASALDELCKRKDVKFKVAFDEYTKCNFLLFVSHPNTYLCVYLVNTHYLEVKNKTTQLLEQVEASIQEERPEAEKLEIDRVLSVRKEYFDRVTAYEEALEGARGDVAELMRQGIEKPVPGEDAQDGDLHNLEELQVAYGTVQEQLEYNNNKDESVVRSYEEKKNLVSPPTFH